MAKIKGLGRGLDALLGGDRSGEPLSDGKSLTELPVEALQPGKYQPRTHMDETALRELADSIKTQGVMQPILVRPTNGGRHEIVAGERRWRAARMAGLATVPVQVRIVPDNTALAMALIENIQREDLNPLEQANAIQRLITEFGVTHDKAAEMVGRSRAAVSNLLRLLLLTPPVRDMLQRGEIDMGHARALLALPSTQQITAAREIVAHGLSVRQTERLVALQLRGGAGKRQQPKTKDRDMLRLQDDLADKLGARVQLDHGNKGKGKVIIHYSSLDELQGILAHIK